MKLAKLSLAAVIALGTSAFAIDNVKVDGQAALYYQTASTDATGSADLFSQDASSANVGLQLNLGAGLGNGFGFGAQGTWLGTLGLEKTLVSGTRQGANSTAASTNSRNSFDVTKLYITKQIGGTTLKLGKQELPKALSPLAFSEGWNVFKNTFNAGLIVNTGLVPDTTLVGAYVSGVNDVSGDLGTFGNLSAKVDTNTSHNAHVENAAYMLTAQNKSIANTTITASYYALKDVNGTAAGSNRDGADALWLDVATAFNGINVGLQGGKIAPDLAGLKDTKAYGIKLNGAVAGFDVTAAYSAVDDGTVQVRNTGGVKTPLYTQMIANQNAIAQNSNTMMLKVTHPSPIGTLVAAYSDSSEDTGTQNDFSELDLAVVSNLGGLKTFVGYVRTDADKVGSVDDVTTDIVRVWTRYNF